MKLFGSLQNLLIRDDFCYFSPNETADCLSLEYVELSLKATGAFPFCFFSFFLLKKNYLFWSGQTPSQSDCFYVWIRVCVSRDVFGPLKWSDNAWGGLSWRPSLLNHMRSQLNICGQIWKLQLSEIFSLSFWNKKIPKAQIIPGNHH